MKNFLKIILVIACLCAGFFMALNIFGGRDRIYTVKKGDEFFKQPSVTAEKLASIERGTELVIEETVELKMPTAAVMAQNSVAEDGEHAKYKLKAGDTYKITAPNLARHNTPCEIEVETLKGKKVRLEVKKSLLLPVDEGRWVRLRTGDASPCWVRISSKWY